jgi:hypothetical protein
MDPATILSTASAAFKLFGGLGANAAAKRDKEEQRGYASRIGNNVNDINAYVADLMRMQPGINGADGSSISYNPATGQWENKLSGREQTLQGANDQEALARDTIDQFIRRQGMVDAERIRGDAATRAGSAADGVDAFQRGVGTVDPTAVGRMMEVDRTSAVNAGYDDVQRGLNRISLRSGADGTAAATALARNRSNDIARTRGSPALEGLSFAQGFNNTEGNTRMNNYGAFAGAGSRVQDSGFGATDRFGAALDRTTQQQGFDLTRRQTGIQGKAAGAQLLSNAARGLRETATPGGGNASLFGDLFSSVSSLARASKG